MNTNETTHAQAVSSTDLLGIVIAVDFDGTCVTHEYPKVGREIGAVPVLRDLVSAGCRLVLWTMRDDGEFTDAVKWFRKHDIPLWGYNQNPEQKSWTQSAKAYANVYIDDAALGAPLRKGMLGERPHIDWQQVREMLLPNAK